MAKTKSFEDNMLELETVVSRLESGDATLDESMKLFEQGIKLSKSCRTMLDKAEQKVTILLQNDDGSEVEEEFDVQEL
ncbi:MAG: exodeoxyribonuclease VII small subunit [Clostridia bacterium]|nr:exodeoxyribonuclease VII small subunit [Clostridia bacterium]MBQ3554321.1 exodeoxyribonuclease VII small subunit [Clostridia bacterium]